MPPKQAANVNQAANRQTYSQVAAGKQPSSIETMLLQIMQRLDKLETNFNNA